ncbi:hypothetical protein DSO57_1010125 [Entomophthora muscae]|uniref:Uncharacterized protein n=1 Tax=Entomophthora muscae TaxID=34485 RepID=A0ACC2SVF7_9FUNG|nr:hypothetical protein DSO57_1010125 [Entomophthora muscae]
MEEPSSESTVVVWLVATTSVMAIAANGWVMSRVCTIGQPGFSKQMAVTLTALSEMLLFSILGMCMASGVVGVPDVFETSWFCPVLGASVSFTTCLTWIISGLLAADHFMVVICEKRSDCRFGWGVLFTVGVGYLVFIAAASSVPDGFIPDPTHTHCSLSNSDWGYLATVALCLIFTSYIVLITTIYFTIAAFCLHKTSRSPRNQNAQRVAMRSLIILTIYYITLVPKIVTEILYVKEESKASFLHILTPVGIVASIAVNPILAISSNQNLLPHFKTLKGKPCHLNSFI